MNHRLWLHGVLLITAVLLLTLPAPQQIATAATTDLFFSEYVEGSSNNKALEIYNGTDNTINLAAESYSVRFYFNGDTSPGTIIDLTGSVASGDVFVLADVDADLGIMSEADQTDGANFFNGDDAVVLLKNGVAIDAIGQVGNDPGSQWGSGGIDTQNNTLRRSSTVCEGDSDQTDAFDPNDEWTGHGEDSFANLGSHTATCSGTPLGGTVLINEVDADTPSTDTAEFVELIGDPLTSLNGLVLVFFNGNGDTAYEAFDLDGQSTDANGYFVLCGNAANVTNCDLDVLPDSSLLQNGADAVALYAADAADFADGTAVTATNLQDAIVYDTNDSDDSGLIDILTSGQPQVNEAEGGDSANHSNQRCPNGSGGAFQTSVYDQHAPTPGATNVCQGGGGGEEISCEDNNLVFTDIPSIQGSGATTPMLGASVDVEAIVTADFQTGAADEDGDLDGFFIQEAGDGNVATSDGVFVFDDDSDVRIGDRVRVRGAVGEFETSGGASSLTQIRDVVNVAVCASGQPLPAAVDVTLPFPTLDYLEQFEGMRVNFPQPLVIAEYFNFDRFNEIVLAQPLDGLERPIQTTAYLEPGPQSLAAADAIALSRITLDDGRTSQNSVPARHPNGSDFGPSNLFRGGDTVEGATGVIDDRFGLYRIQPTEGATYTATNPRQATPDDVGGTLKVVSFNVLNYFLTLDGSGSICGGNQNLSCRGADSASELTRQRTKLLTALLAAEADIYGMIEIENTPGVEPLADLVQGMNGTAGAGTYDYIDTGVIGTDAIRVGLIYNTMTVSPAGGFAILDSSVDATYLDNKNRPSLAQSFDEVSTGERFTVSVNHFKSKGSSCADVGDPTDPNGQGNCNGVRTDAAVALANWLASDPTSSGDPDIMIIGDLNAYDKEDPIDALRAAGYTDLALSYGGEFAYSYVFSGQFGYLDYALVNSSLLLQVTGLTEWHINADEPDIWDYDESFNESGFFEANVFRTSDHDPIIVGLGLTDMPVQNLFLPIITTN